MWALAGPRCFHSPRRSRTDSSSLDHPSQVTRLTGVLQVVGNHADEPDPGCHMRVVICVDNSVQLSRVDTIHVSKHPVGDIVVLAEEQLLIGPDGCHVFWTVAVSD